MKIYSYYTKRKERCHLISSDEDTFLDSYSALFIWKEHINSEDPRKILDRSNNIMIGGFGFNEKHIPLPENMRKSTPSLILYKDFINNELRKKTRKIRYTYSAFYDSSFIRLWEVENNQPIFIKENRPVILYDREVFINNWREKIYEIQEQKPKRYVFVWPQKIKDLKTLLEVIKRNIFNSAFERYEGKLVIDFDLNIFDVQELVYVYKKYNSQMISKTLQVPLLYKKDLTKSTEFEIMEHLEKSLNFIYYMISRGIIPKLYCESNNSLKVLCTCIMRYFNCGLQKTMSLGDYITKHSMQNDTMRLLLGEYSNMSYLFNKSLYKLQNEEEWECQKY